MATKCGRLKILSHCVHCLDDVAVGVHYREAMFPLGVYTHRAFPQLRSVVGILAAAAGPR